MSKNIDILKNKMILETHILSNVHSVTISMNFRVGSLYEKENEKGLTHLVEHLFYRRLYDLSQADLYDKMHRLGTEIIGKTYDDYVSFSVTVVPEFFIEVVNIITKILYEFQWTDKEIEAEKNVVIRQIENSYENYTQWVDGCYLKDTLYSMPIMGTEESVLKLEPSKINFWKNRYFTPANCCMVITGNITVEEINIVKTIVSSFSAEKTSNYKYNRIISKPAYFAERNQNNRYNFSKTDNNFSEIIIYFDVDDKLEYEKVRLLVSILGEGCGSKLSMILREKYSVTDDVFIRLTSYYAFSNIIIYFTVKNIYIYRAITLFFSVLQDFCNNITEDDYESSIHFFTENQLMDLDDAKSLNNFYVLSDFVLGSAITSNLISEPIERKKRYERIGIEELLVCAKSIFVPENISFLLETSENTDKLSDYIESQISKLCD